MKTRCLFLLCVFGSVLSAQKTYFPPIGNDSWETISPTAVGWCNEKIDSLYTFLEEKNTKAFIVLKDGKIALEKYFGTFTKDSAWYWASAGKTLTALLIGIAQQDSLLNINDTTSKYLGDNWTGCSKTNEDKITIRHQLTMTSGLNDKVDDQYCTLDTCLLCLAEPNTRWAYHNGPYTLLDEVIKEASGKSMNLFFNQKLGSRIGMNGAFIKSGYNNVFFSKARNMARFALLVLNKGIWDSDTILSDTVYYNEMISTSQNLNKSYGYLWWLNGKESYMIPSIQFVFNGKLNENAPDDMFSALGKNGQIINIVPSSNLVMIRLGNVPDAGEVPITFNDSIWYRFNKIYCTSSLTEKVSININMYPNPSNGTLFIECPDEIFRIELFDLQGRLLYTENTSLKKIQVNLNHLSPGSYIIRCTTNSAVTKIIRIE